MSFFTGIISTLVKSIRHGPLVKEVLCLVLCITKDMGGLATGSCASRDTAPLTEKPPPGDTTSLAIFFLCSMYEPVVVVTWREDSSGLVLIYLSTVVVSTPPDSLFLADTHASLGMEDTNPVDLWKPTRNSNSIDRRSWPCRADFSSSAKDILFFLIRKLTKLIKLFLLICGCSSHINKKNINGLYLYK